MDCQGQFDIIRYLSGMTGFVFDKDVLLRVATDRGVLDVSVPEQLTQKQKDLLLADLLFVAYMSPNITASHTNQHGLFIQTVGSQTINNKNGIYKMMIDLYRKWGDSKAETIPNTSNTLTWME